MGQCRSHGHGPLLGQSRTALAQKLSSRAVRAGVRPPSPEGEERAGARHTHAATQCARPAPTARAGPLFIPLGPLWTPVT